MWFFLCNYALMMTTIANAEIITVARESSINCVVTGSSANSAIYLNPPVKSDFIKPTIKVDKWVIDDWTIMNSTSSNYTFVTDKRWEEFDTFNGDVGHSLEDKPLSFSICLSGDLSIHVFSSDFANELFVSFTPTENNFTPKRNKCRWFHYVLLKESTVMHLISVDEITKTYDLGFDPFWIYFKNSDGDSTFWKLHDYNFRVSTEVTQEQKSTLGVSLIENLCLSLYASVDKNCYLEIVLETGNSTTRRTVLGFNENDSLKKWQRFEIQNDTPGEGKLSFYRGRTQQGSINGYWAIDKITFCNKDIEIYQVQLTNEAPDEYVCEALNKSKESTLVSSPNVLSCDNPGFLGTNCNISCATVLGESYHYCENHTICQDASTCFCSWGYQGQLCDRRCEEGTWGLFCRNRCTSECQKCHPSTGECLKPQNNPVVESLTMESNKTFKSESVTEEDLPVNIIMTSNQINISLPNFESKPNKNFTYYIEYVCVSMWCKNEVVKEEAIAVTSTQNLKKFIPREFKELKPFTDYTAVINATVKNQSVIKTYHIIKTDQESLLEVENLSIYCSNSTSLWIRFSLTQSADVDLSPYKIWFHKNNSTPKYTTNVYRCKIWDNFICGRIDDLQHDSVYSITVEYNETTHQKWGLSKTVIGFTSQKVSGAPEDLKITWSNSEAILTWNHPSVTNGPLQKFVIEIDNENMVKSYTVDVLEPQRTYQYKVPVNYYFQYIIAVRAFNKYEGERNRISATFFPISSKFPAENNVVVETCSTKCHLLIPKPELKNGSNCVLLGIPGNETKHNIIKKLKAIKSEPQENKNGWLIFEKVDYDENYFEVEMATSLKNTVSLSNNKSYSFYLALLDNIDNNSAIYPIGTSEEETKRLETWGTVLTPITYVAVIIISVLLLLLLLLMLLFTLHKRKHVSQSNVHPNENLPEHSEQRKLMSNFNENFTKIETRFLENYLKHALLTGKDLINQFRSLPVTTKPMVHAFHSKNKNKNKDQQNVSYDCSRVILKKMEELGMDDYINASYINGFDRPKTYIATQGPKFYTVRDFWRMIWQERVETIVMATNFMESKQRKCAEYFPQTLNAVFECGAMFIKLIKEEVYEHYICRFFETQYQGFTRKVQHFYLRWTPDDLTPLYANCLVPLVQRISAIRERSSTPIVVHCSSGTNRTGTLILCDLALHMAKVEKSVDFCTLIRNMRDQRPNMINSEKQYILAHLVVLECLMEQENIFKKIIKDNISSSLLQSQLDYLKRLRWHDEIVQKWTPPRSSLNEYELYSVDGYATYRKFLVSHQPSKNSLHNFWNVVIQEKIYIILFLNQDRSQMWPYQRQTFNTMITVKELQSVKTSYCTLTTLLLLVWQIPANNIIFEQTIYLFQANSGDHRLSTRDANEYLNILDDIIKNCKKERPILVACHDGVTMSGLFVTLSYIIEKCKNEFGIDVCNGVRTVRRSGAPFVKTPVQMEFLYKAVSEYLQKFDEYSSIL